MRPSGAGLLGDQRAAEHGLGGGDDLLERAGEADAALVAGVGLHEVALAAAAGMDLRLDHPEPAAKLLRRLLRIRRREDGYAARDRRAEFAQDRLGLVFVDVHLAAVPSARAPEAMREAGLDEPVDGGDGSVEHLRSGLLRSISMMRSTPLAPITTGTPI